MINLPLSQLPAERTLDLLFTYGRAYRRYYSPNDVEAAVTASSTTRCRTAARWAAAATLRVHEHRRRQTVSDYFSRGPAELDSFVVALATRRANQVANAIPGMQPADADDVAGRVGEQLLKVMNRSSLGPWMTQPPEPPALGEWVKTAVRNVLRNNHRYHQRHPELPVDTDDLIAMSTGSQTFEIGSDIELIDALDRTDTNSLSADDRRVMGMVSHLEMTQVEVAAALGVSPQAINQRIGRIRSKAPELATQLAVR